MQLIFEKSRPGRRALTLDPLDVPKAELPAGFCRETPPALPEVGEWDVVRHFTHLSRRNFGLDSQGAGQAEALLLAAGKPGGQRAQPLLDLVPQTDRTQLDLHAGGDLSPGRAL